MSKLALQTISHMPMAFLVITLSLVSTGLISVAGQLRPWPSTLPQCLLGLDIAGKLHYDPNTTSRFSTDYGRLTKAAPAAVLYPSSSDDIAALIRFSYSSSRSFKIAARGHGHSVRGQTLAPDGVVIDMESLGGGRINVQLNDAPGQLRYVDAGGEQLWIDVLHETLRHGVAPRSWTDYLYLTVGGTLSNAGISGQAFRHGPQISNVYELDVITGKGDRITCSREVNSDLFYGVLGGLGQFGIITRARIALEPAPERVRWVRLIYTDFGRFTRDEELLMSSMPEKGFDYVEGQLLMDKGFINSSFFSDTDSEKIKELAIEFGTIYFVEGALYYKFSTASLVDQKLDLLLEKLNFVPGFVFTKDVSYLQFLDRVHADEIKLRPLGLWDVPHPWLNLFVPKSRLRDFELGVFKGILKNIDPMGPLLMGPMNKTKWDERMSVSIPDEEIFYGIGFLRAATVDIDWKYLDSQNEEIMRFCHQEGIEFKQYLPHYTTQADWKQHFGHKWDWFVQLKRRYDPKALLSPGQHIFTTQL